MAITIITIPTQPGQGPNGTFVGPSAPPPSVYLKQYCDGVNYYYALTQEDITAVDLQFSPTTAQLLAEAIEKKKTAINSNTGYLITVKGFPFADFQFPCDQLDQLNATGLLLKKVQNQIPVDFFPRPIKRYNQINETGLNYFDLTSDNLDGYTNAILAHVDGYLRSGIDLKSQCDACTTIEELNAIVDTRS